MTFSWHVGGQLDQRFAAGQAAAESGDGQGCGEALTSEWEYDNSALLRGGSPKAPGLTGLGNFGILLFWRCLVTPRTSE